MPITYETDADFEDVVLDTIQESETGWELLHAGTGYWLSKPSPIIPTEGMTARFYGGARAGCRVRGLKLDDTIVFYRTPEEDKQKADDDLYGKDASDILTRWDNGQSIFTIEMGGLGPGYEQCIHVTAMEILRYLLTEKPDQSLWEDEEIWKSTRAEIEKAVMPRIDHLGLSGAQWGAALSLSTAFYMRGPQTCLNEVPKDRHIQVSKDFPREKRA